MLDLLNLPLALKYSPGPPPVQHTKKKRKKNSSSKAEDEIKEKTTEEIKRDTPKGSEEENQKAEDTEEQDEEMKEEDKDMKVDPKQLQDLLTRIQQCTLALDDSFPPSTEAIQNYLLAFENQSPPDTPPYRTDCYVPGRFECFLLLCDLFRVFEVYDKKNKTWPLLALWSKSFNAAK